MPLVTIALVAINVIAYLLEIRHGGSFFGGPSDTTAVHYGAIPYELTHPGKHCGVATITELGSSRDFIACEPDARRLLGAAPESQPATWITVFTSMFLHGSFLHIFGNMLFLIIFGPNVEDAVGRGRYLAFYLLGGLVALAAQVAVGPNSIGPTLGASGAIAAVLGGYILLYPRARVITLVFIVFFFTIVELPAVVLLGLWFLEQLWFGLAGLAGPLAGAGGVAYFAHIGGFLFGLAAIRAFAARRSPTPPALA
ncbi:MAG TPA: rhomboid family intramembrane serine protease [Solirubrobacteraceae bacterium]|nr:rhomboid family intramembrane serine protease [Solirubrobacteraceae bacterium]